MFITGVSNEYKHAPSFVAVQVYRAVSRIVALFEYYKYIPPLSDALRLLNVQEFTSSVHLNEANIAEPNVAEEFSTVTSVS